MKYNYFFTPEKIKHLEAWGFIWLEFVTSIPAPMCFLNYICEMPFDDTKKSRALINIFVNSVYLYDDYFTIIINASRKPIHIDNIQLDDIEAAFKKKTNHKGASSSMTNFAPPNEYNPNLYPIGNGFGFFVYIENI